MNLLGAFLASVLTCSFISAAEERCKLEGISEFFHNYNEKVVYDDYSGLLAEIADSNIKSAELSDDNDHNYIKVSSEKGKIVVSTTDAFADYELERASTIYNCSSFSTYIVVTCVNNETMRFSFMQYVCDINNHAPTFSQDVYEYRFGMSLKAGFDITPTHWTNNQLPTASDDDMSSSGTFNFRSSDPRIVLKSVGSLGNGVQQFAISLAEDVEMPFDESFDIEVEDNGQEPYLTGKSKVRLILEDEPKTALSPLFSKALYHFEYNNRENKFTSNEPVQIVRGITDKLTVKANNYQDNLKLELKADGAVAVSVVSAFKTTADPFILIELEAENPGAKQTARTVIFIKIDQ